MYKIKAVTNDHIEMVWGPFSSKPDVAKDDHHFVFHIEEDGQELDLFLPIFGMNAVGILTLPNEDAD